MKNTVLTLLTLVITFSATAQGANSLHFDGTDDYISGTGPALANQSFSIEFWAQRAVDKYQMLLFIGSNAANQGLIIVFRDSKTVFSFYSDDLYSESTIDGNWHHYAMTYDQSTKTQSIYIDGVLDNTRTANADYSGSDAMLIGRQLDNANRFFGGDLDELRIWNTTRSAGDIAAFMNCELNGDETDLLAYYPLNQGDDGGDNSTVTTLTDATSNGYNGTLTDFALNGTTSNWTGNSPIAVGTACGSAPRLHAIGNQSVEQNTELIFTASASDLDSPTLTYSIDGVSSGKGMTINATTGGFSWTPNSSQTGSHIVTITVSDGELEDSGEITILVTSPTSFITTWKTDNSGTSADDQITIPTTGTGYSYKVDWGDGISDETTYTGDATHQYATAGTYTVSITGDFPRIYFGNSGDKDKILTVEQWGEQAWASMQDAFYGCTNLTIPATDTPNLENVTNMRYMFRETIINRDLDAWDVSSVTDMTGMFIGATFFNRDLDAWDVSHVTNMSYMFYAATAFNGDISTWNVSSVTNMEGMFANATSFNSAGAGLGTWDIGNVTYMEDMLGNSGLSTDNYDATLIGWATLDAGETKIPTGVTFDATGLTYCNSADARDLLTTATGVGGYGWTINGDTEQCRPFITTWQTDNPGSPDDLSITIPITGTGYDYTVYWEDYYDPENNNNKGEEISFDDSNTPHTITFPATGSGFYRIEISGNFPGIYFNNSGDKNNILSINQWGTQAWVSMQKAFYGCNNLAVINATDVPNVDQVTDMSYMFSATSVKGDLGAWDVSSVTNMSNMFADATSFNADLSAWDVSNVTNMSEMFSNAYSFNHDLGAWDISSVTDMTDMLSYSALSIANYDATLIGWADDNGGSETIPTGITLGAVFKSYSCAAETAYELLIGTYGWSIIDEGQLFDIIKPVPDAASLDNITAACEVMSLTAPTATDNCAGAITGTHDATLPITASTTITWTFSDEWNNEIKQTQEVVIEDTTDPVADAASLDDITAACEVTSLTAPTATDNCAGPITGTHDATLPITENKTITWTFTDGSGNESTQTQNVVIEDTTTPVADAESLDAITAACEVTSLTAPTATDNCSGAINGNHDATLPITESTIITWTFTDGSGNESTQTQNVVIDDTTAPVADVESLDDITATCEVTSLTAPTATDNCSGAITGTHDATLPITESTTVTWTFIDGSGNESTQTQNMVIEDTTTPVADAESLDDISAACEVTSLTAPTATDNCSGSISGTHNATLPITASTTIIWTFTDGSDNESTQPQEVVIEDTTAPVVDAESLDDITAACEVTSLTAPTATDNCSGSISGTHNTTLPITASTTITWTFIDGSGNTSSQTQEVVIEDPTAPELAAIGNHTVDEGAELTFTATVTDVGCSVLTYSLDGTSSDKGMVIDASSGAFTWTPTTGQVGDHSVTITVSDGELEDSKTISITVNAQTVLGMDDRDENSISVFPNPVAHELRIDSDYTEVALYNINGELMKEWKGNKRLDVSGISAGVYILKVTTDKGRFVHKLIKE